MEVHHEGVKWMPRTLLCTVACWLPLFFFLVPVPAGALTASQSGQIERARYLNPNTGRFWSMDSFEGNNEDPLSLHKYLYCHGNPVNGFDPSGHEFNIIGLWCAVPTDQASPYNHQPLNYLCQAILRHKEYSCVQCRSFPAETEI